MRNRPGIYVRVMCPPYTAEDAEFMAERNRVLEQAVHELEAENGELQDDNRNLKEYCKHLREAGIEEMRRSMVERYALKERIRTEQHIRKKPEKKNSRPLLYRTTVGVTQWVVYWLNTVVKAGNWLIGSLMDDIDRF